MNAEEKLRKTQLKAQILKEVKETADKNFHRLVHESEKSKADEVLDQALKSI